MQKIGEMVSVVHLKKRVRMGERNLGKLVKVVYKCSRIVWKFKSNMCAYS